MKLFKNEVGRPSNETLKKRKIAYLFITVGFLALIGLLFGGLYSLTSFSDKNNLKGASNKNVVYKTSTYTDKNVTYYFSSKTAFQSVKHNGTIYMFGNLPKEFSTTLYVTNNNKFDIRVKGIYDDKYHVVKSGGKIQFNMKLLTGQYKSIFVYDNRKSLSSAIALSSISLQTDYSKNSVILFNDYSNIKGFTYVTHNSDIYKEQIDVNSYGNKSNKYTIYNRSGKTYYYRWFTYKNTSIKKTEISYNDIKGNCVAIKGNGSITKSPGLNVSKTYPKRLGYVKIYSNQKSCKNDTYGTTNNNVVFTWKTIISYKSSK